MIQKVYSYKFLLLILCLILLILRFLSEPTRILTWDVFGYYLYLPAKFIYNDLSLLDHTWLNNLLNTYDPTATLYQAIKLDNGSFVMKYSMGMSILYAPFFFIAHLIAEPLGFPADGLSLPYQYTITIGGLIYAILGLLFLAKILLQFFNNRIVCITIVVIFAGTNYLQLTAYDGTLLSHNFLFTLYAILTYYTIKWYNNQKLKYAIIIGLSVGMITLIRPSEVVCVLIPLLWYTERKNYIKGKIELFRSHISHLAIVAACFLLILMPQIIYWKIITGKFLFYSYTNAGEGLDFLFPHIINFLFSFRKGWFVYTPIMIFSFIGLYQLYKKNSPLFIAITVFIVMDVYLISCWTNWWYAGGSFSSRSIVPAYVLLAIPLGYFIDKVYSYSKPKKVMFITIGFVLIFLNLFQTWQFKHGIIDKERMTREYYFAIFGKTKLKQDDKKLLLVNRSVEGIEHFENKEDYKESVLYLNTFDDDIDSTTNTKGVFCLNKDIIFSPGLDIQYKEITKQDHAWIRASVKIFVQDSCDKELPLLVTCFHYKGKAYKYRAESIIKENLKYNAWNELTIDYMTPEVRTKNDNLKVYVWNKGQRNVLVDSLIVYVYEPE